MRTSNFFYDFKQLSRVYYKIIQKFLKSLNFFFTKANVLIFIHENKQTFICVYVDDVLLFELDLNLLKHIKIKLNEYFKMINLRFLSHYLNIKIIRFFNRISLNQTFYLLKILKRFKIIHCKSMNIVMKSDIYNVIMFFDDNYKVDNNIIY